MTLRRHRLVIRVPRGTGNPRGTLAFRKEPYSILGNSFRGFKKILLPKESPMTEQHFPQFRGIWLPPDIVDDFIQDRLDYTSLRILIVTEGMGYAVLENYHCLKKVTGETLAQINRRVRELVTGGFLIQNGDTFRTSWSGLPAKGGAQ